MTAHQGGFEDEGDEDSCMSCLDTRKYRCLCCKFSLCNKCSLPEENDEIPGWKAGKFIGYCVPCSKEPFEQGTQYSTHAVGGENAFAVFGLKAPFSLACRTDVLAGRSSPRMQLVLSVCLAFASVRLKYAKITTVLKATFSLFR